MKVLFKLFWRRITAQEVRSEGVRVDMQRAGGPSKP